MLLLLRAMQICHMPHLGIGAVSPQCCGAAFIRAHLLHEGSSMSIKPNHGWQPAAASLEGVAASH